MNRLRESRLIRVLLSAGLLWLACPVTVFAQAAPPPAQVADVDAVLGEARELIKNGDYTGAIEILKSAIDQTRNRFEGLREAYLLLIKATVILGNYQKSQQQGRELSRLAYQEARSVIAECLRIKELRHTVPEPESEYPAEMIQAFAEVRGKIFGSFRVSGLEPADANVVLDADTLRALPGQQALSDVDLAVGPHLVVIRRVGYKDLTDEISISPGATLEQSYSLEKNRGRMWYAKRGAAGLGVVGGVIALIVGRGSKPTVTTIEPLPGAPPPPPSN